MVKKLLFGLILGIFLMSFASALPSSLTINSPQDGQDYGSVIDSIVWGFSGGELNSTTDKCWHKLNDGAWTEFSCFENVGGIASIEGNNTWVLKINDSSNSVEKTVRFWVDNIEPVVIVSSPTFPLAYTNGNSLIITALLAETNIKKYNDKDMKLEILEPGWESPATNYFNSNVAFTYSNSLDKEGYHDYTIYARDKYPNGTTIREVSVSGTIVRDISAPTIEDDYAFDGVWINSAQTTIFTAFDAVSGIDTVKYCSGGECSPADGTIIIGLPYQLVHSIDTDTWIIYQTWDNAGNPSGVGNYHLMLDQTPPVTIDNAPGEGNWQIGDVLVTITPSDATSGVAATYYCADQTNTCVPETAYSEPIVVSSEGINYVRYFSIDNAGNSEAVKTGIVIIDQSDPLASITSPDVSSWHNSDFSVSRTDSDAISGLNHCEISIWNSEEAPSLDWQGVECNQDYLLDLSEYCPNEGSDSCVVIIKATDNVGREATDTRAFSIDTTPPTTTPSGAPEDWTNSDVIITLDASDNSAPLPSCLSIEEAEDVSGVAETYYCVDSSDECSPDILYSEPIVVSAEGRSYVRYYSIDNAGNSEDIQSVEVKIDKSGPEIILGAPADNSAFAFDDNNITFSYDANDIFSLIGKGNKCALTVNGAENQTQTLEDAPFILYNLVPGFYTWKITCADNVENNGSSEERAFTILAEQTEASEFDDYTDLTGEDNISDVFDFFVQNTFGKIQFKEAVNFSSGFDWSKFINISDNRIEVNSTGAPELNKSARITIYNLTFTNPRIIVNGEVCSSPICTVISYINRTLIFDVTGFSVYNAEETPPYSPPSGGGGGSSTSSICSERWICADWNSCSSGTQTRTCTDSNSCGTSFTKPAESQKCEILQQTVSATESIEPSETENPQTGAGAGITGAVIGTLTKNKMAGVVVLIAVVGALFFGVRYLRKKNEVSNGLESV